MPPRSLRIAVIGAGGAGLVAARELRHEGHAPVVFERAAGVGGTWLYSPASAEPLGSGGTHSSMYASLRTNLSREAMGFLDFPFSAGSDDPRRFPGHAEVLRYLQEFARRFDLDGLVRLETEVVRVRREEGRASWRVRYSSKAGSEKKESEEAFDAVVVCNGHYTEPRLAVIPGVDAWPGQQMHSHNYRVPAPFRDQVVVIIGGQASAMDISRDIASVAKEVHIANRSAPAAATTNCERQPAAGHHHNLWIHPMIERAQEDGSVVFQDGSSIKADAILHCTGYKYRFPFLGDDSTICVDDNRVGPLYKHVFPPQVAPQLSFIGLPFKVLPFPLFQLQSNWVAGVLSGRIELPSKEEMMEDARTFYLELEARGWPTRYTHNLGDNKFEYEDWLAEQCGHETIEEWRKQMFAAGLKNMADRPDSYRDVWDDGHLLPQAYQDFRKYTRGRFFQLGCSSPFNDSLHSELMNKSATCVLLLCLSIMPPTNN